VRIFVTTVDPRADLSALHGPDGSGLKFLLGQYVSLMKPRIIELLLITTIPVMFLAEQGVPDLWLVVATVVGGTLSAGAANTLNCYIDRDIDAVMHRTSRRPLVTGTISPRGALVFGVTLTVASTLWLGLLVNWLSAWLALGALLFYVFGYTLLLKRRTAQNIVWGGAAGCMPVLIGWSAVTGSLSWSAFILFLVIFFWTPPHYWPLSMRYKDDYASARVPMLPVVERFVVVAKQVAAYSWAMVLTSLALIPVQQVGWVYTVAAVVSGVLFLGEAHRLLSRARAGAAEDVLKPMRLFHFSITYLTILFVGVALDPIWHLPLPFLP
jgi:heme o synthase